jgi:hypothetical protein
MKEPIQIIVGANQPKEIWDGWPRDLESVARFDLLMKIFGLSEAEVQIIKWEQE